MKDSDHPKNWTSALVRHASMAEKRRLERHQNEIERIREAKAVDAKAQSRDDERSEDETPENESR